MGRRLPLILSSVAVLVAVLGSTPLGEAAGDVVRAVPPFAKRSGYAKLAGTADNAKRLAGHRASAAPAAGVIPITGADGKLGASLLAIAPVDTSKLLGRTLTISASKTLHGGGHYDYVLCPAGYEAVGGGAYAATDAINTDVEILSSAPTDGSGVYVADGQGAAARGWGTWVNHRPPTLSRVVHWTVVCAKVGP